MSTIALLGCHPATPRSIESAEELRRVFSDTISIREAGGGSVEFCPDNTCETFTSSKAGSGKAVCDFGYLYLFYVSRYSMLDTVRRSPTVRSGAYQLLKRYSAGRCKEKEQGAMVRCVLRYLTRQSSIEISFVRFDEHYRSEQRVDLEEALAAAGPPKAVRP